jgi:hypothetical protein
MHQTTVKPTIVVVSELSLHPSLLSPLPSPITSASTIIGSHTTPLHCCVYTLPVNFGNSIVFINQ